MRRDQLRALRQAAEQQREEQRVEEYNQQVEAQAVAHDTRIAELEERLAAAAVAERATRIAHDQAVKAHGAIYAEIMRAQRGDAT